MSEGLELAEHEARFWEYRYRVQHKTVHKLEDALAAERQHRERLQGALCEARDALLTYMQGESGLPFTEPYGAVRKALGYIDAALSENGNGGTDEDL